MRLISTTVVALLVIGTLIIQSIGKEEPPKNDKISFLKGVSRLKEQTGAIFNEQTLTALKPIKDILITSEFERDYRNELQGVIRVRIRTTKDSGHVKLFWLSLRDKKWKVTRCAMEPWESKYPPSVRIEKIETEQFVEKVESCFNQP